ncbi:hypothetical protein [Paenibacillus ehimensis]|uniref:hypothetical protein n=1 Tax=Paenibacillus ehimensis TaxID=79264 RepID=UPI000FDAAE68|nr:hypothetical protein [Paenibacillus ehimensis]
MKFVDYYGDDRLRHKIVYNKNSYSECIYCGKQANTREHIPSRVFLSKPYPSNLAIVPACVKCNNSFSNDELFLSILIEKLKIKHFGQNYVLSEEADRRIKQNEKLAHMIDAAIENERLDEFNKKISRVIFKLAIGHSVYELSEGYCIEDGTVKYSFLNHLSAEEVDEFSLPFNLNGQLFPEIGSRVYERILFLEVNFAAASDPEQLTAPLVLLDWVDVQEKRYSYTSYRFGDEIVVKMIINEFLYAQVILNVEVST